MTEVYPALHDYWYIACFARELNDRPLARTILGKPLVLFRHDGKPACLLDVCPHRNLGLSKGRLDPQGLQCAYHGWVFDREGRCVRIPADCAGEAGARAQSFRTAESQGFIWVFMGKQAPADPPLFPMFSEPRWQHWFMERTFEGSAFQCVENFLDVPHTVFVHNKLFRSAEGKETELEITQTQTSVQARFLEERDVDGLVGKLLVPHGADMLHTDCFLLPSTTRVDYRFSPTRHFIVMSQCTPVTASVTRVYTYMAFRFDPIAPLVRLVYAPLAARILDQDVVVIREQSENIARFGGEQFHFHQTDAIAREIRLMMEGRPVTNGITRKRIRA
jgi:phenylpropionate dioxygenase-like ring-hydroxylating dioxygenase large terminal subunit